MMLDECLAKLERHVAEKDYAGFCKFDALNSPLLEKLFGFSSLTRLLAVQVINRVPLPLRSWVGIRPARNPKGIANFLRAYCKMHEVGISNLPKIRSLASWLLDNHSQLRSSFRGNGLGWGYHFPWQSPGFYAPRYFPNCIVTTFCGESLLDAYGITGDEQYLKGAVGAKRFIMEDLPVLFEAPEKRCIGYVTGGLRWCVININSVAAGFIAKLAKQTGSQSDMEAAKKMIRWTLGAQQADGSWNYTHPKSQSGIGPDNYHTGGILDGIFDTMMASGDFSFKENYKRSLEFYKTNFFEADGAPKWRMNRSYPMDIHGAAQGIITFAKASALFPDCLSMSQRIATWAMQHMQDPDEGFFYYQKYKRFTWKINLMRWNNSWMMLALSELQAAQAASETARLNSMGAS
ncbi:MAG: hypothetical protein HY537_15615 [Deltaproteobacteria bacterium]|nr:hypothetical protein [Deltaproteobacteria bacterium]